VRFISLASLEKEEPEVTVYGRAEQAASCAKMAFLNRSGCCQPALRHFLEFLIQIHVRPMQGRTRFLQEIERESFVPASRVSCPTGEEQWSHPRI
jgi:hypothetical protein